MNDKIRNVIKNISYSFVANIISMVLGILATLLFPKFLGVSEYGYYQLYIFYVGYLLIPALGIADGVQLEIAGKKYTDFDFDKQTAVFWFSTIVQVILYAALLIISVLFVTDADKKFVFVCDCIVGLIYYSRYYLYMLLQGVNRIKEYADIIITERSVSIIISIIALLLGCNNYKLMIIFDVIGRILSFIIAVFYCKEIVIKLPHISASTIKQSLGYIASGVMILLAVQAGSLIIGINRYGIEKRWGIDEFGKISLAIALSNMALRCVNSISIVLFPTLRNIDNKKLPLIYENLNVALMSVIFILMCFFKPVCYIMGLWLPQYADSLRYSILLLPVCIYECKYSLLINTNLKNLNKEKIIGIINVISIVLSFIAAYISIFVLENVEMAAIGMLFALSLRSIIGELIIGSIFRINVIKNIILELLLSIIYIICNYYIATLLSAAFYIACVFIYIYIEREKIKYLTKKIVNNGRAK